MLDHDDTLIPTAGWRRHSPQPPAKGLLRIRAAALLPQPADAWSVICARRRLWIQRPVPGWYATSEAMLRYPRTRRRSRTRCSVRVNTWLLIILRLKWLSVCGPAKLDAEDFTHSF
jgi:hypothetical protein